MLLIQINKLSRGLFSELSKYNVQIEDALIKSNGILRDLCGLEMENTCLHYLLDNCKSFTYVQIVIYTFRTPQYDRVIGDTHLVELTTEYDNQTLYEKQTERLKHELNERKRCHFHCFFILERRMSWKKLVN